MASIRCGEHILYLGHKVQGSMGTVFAKCTCGAYLKTQEDIDEHRDMHLGVALSA